MSYRGRRRKNPLTTRVKVVSGLASARRGLMELLSEREKVPYSDIHFEDIWMVNKSEDMSDKLTTYVLYRVGEERSDGTGKFGVVIINDTGKVEDGKSFTKWHDAFGVFHRWAKT